MRFLDRYEKGPTGLFVLDVFRDGKLIEHYEDKNLVVIGSQPTHAALLGGNVTNQSVTKFGVGTNATAPVFGNTSLTGQYANAITQVTYPASNQVQFAFALGSADSPAFGMAISEFGLLTGIGTLYARKTRSTPLNFASDIAFSGTWTISF
ncbi:hypothetical protein PQR39_35115 [Paraburkholderia sediminicola]|uniref:hypothetical protein n=1 Tax=Paraburkholderia sediminicola TaxID=458836 RepID=UPI0038B994D0